MVQSCIESEYVRKRAMPTFKFNAEANNSKSNKNKITRNWVKYYKKILSTLSITFIHHRVKNMVVV